jgi:predicted N-acetyltransferase YhbS
MIEIKLRDATSDDVERITSVIRAAFEEYEGLLDPPSGAHAEDPAHVRMKMAKGSALMAYLDSACAGCVLFYPQEDYLYLGRLAVLPAFRRSGVAQALVSAVEAKGAKIGLSKVQLGVRIALPHNRVFFERLGYSVIAYGTHPGYREPTFMTLEKEIGS